MTGKKKILVSVLAIAIFFAMMLSVAVFTQDRDHECGGIGCDVCQQMASARQLLEMLTSVTLTVAFMPALICTGTRSIHRLAQRLPQGSLIALKVELLN